MMGSRDDSGGWFLGGPHRSGMEEPDGSCRGEELWSLASSMCSISPHASPYLGTKQAHPFFSPTNHSGLPPHSSQRPPPSLEAIHVYAGYHQCVYSPSLSAPAHLMQILPVHAAARLLLARSWPQLLTGKPGLIPQHSPTFRRPMTTPHGPESGATSQTVCRVQLEQFQLLTCCACTCG